ncbi:MAG: NAD(P)-binding protein [Desulfobacterales bacterium]|nr:NAD(P)-binding protein [Desulfobacterales bacterium]
MKTKSYECCVLGGGPAGLAAALELTGNGVTNILVIDRNENVGGLSRTEVYDGSRFDIGPHRFFSKSPEINNLWRDTLGSDFKPVDRTTRICYKNAYFNYPIKLLDVLTKMGPGESFQAMLSFVAAKLNKKREAVTFEDWITDKFGRKLFETFFKTYTEKVWGIPCNQIGAEWAAQRIKGLDVIEVLRNALFGMGRRQVKTLVEQFDYPVNGAGQMYEAMCDKVAARGADIMLNTRVVGINQKDDAVESIDVAHSDGQRERITANRFFSSIPLTHVFDMLSPAEPDSISRAVEALYYRDHITVNLLVEGADLFPDQWIYIHSPEVQTARLANYNNFSRRMAGSENKTGLSVEYFVFQHEDLWKQPDEALKILAVEELERLKLLKKSAVEKAWVVRETECYPTYYLGFQEHYDLLKSRLGRFTNLVQIGRGGLYKYNNQDHSIMSGLLAARNYLKLPGSPYNLWEINVDAEYHESAEREAT